VKVYVLEYEMDYEFSRVVGVFASCEAAQAHDAGDGERRDRFGPYVAVGVDRWQAQRIAPPNYGQTERLWITEQELIT
jgi:hypothetical protein